LEKEYLLNNLIKTERVLLLNDTEGGKSGEMSLREALYYANEKDLDLMQVGEKNNMAICKILNYDSWLYHESKKKQKQEFKNRSQELKSINFRPVTDDHDFNLKIKKISEFLNDNHKVKISIRLKSREGAMRSINEAVVEKIITALSEKGIVDSKINWGFREINFIVKPEKKNVAKTKP
jgi:translation initiation factor IF-3